MEVYINKTKKWHKCSLLKKNPRTYIVSIPDLKYKNSKEYGIELKVRAHKIINE